MSTFAFHLSRHRNGLETTNRVRFIRRIAKVVCQGGSIPLSWLPSHRIQRARALILEYWYLRAFGFAKGQPAGIALSTLPNAQWQLSSRCRRWPVMRRRTHGRR
jgi:hypothetical protein